MNRRIARTSVDRVAALSAADRDAMFTLLARYYDNVTRDEFDRDLDAKQALVRMFDSHGGLAGFSTIQTLELRHGGRRALCVFSGDTVIDQDCWGQKALQNGFMRFLVGTWLRHPFTPIYWFLISKGFKTYLLMRNNFASWPSYQGPTPGEVQAVLHEVAQTKYPEHYDPERGVISFPGQPAPAVKGEYLGLTAEEMSNPEIRYFLQANPGYVAGDELCCLAKVRLRELLWIGSKYGLWYPLRRLLGLAPKRKALPPPVEPELSPTDSAADQPA